MAVGDWVPMVRYGTQLQLDFVVGGDQLRLDQLIVATGDDLGLQAESGIVETQNEVLVKRVVGGVIFRGAFEEGHTLILKERIRVGLLDDAGNATFFAQDSMMDPGQANEPFLWERLSTFEVTGGIAFTWPQADVGHPGWSQIDVRVARKLSRAEALFYSLEVTHFEAAPFDVTDVMSVLPCLRAWARALA